MTDTGPSDQMRQWSDTLASAWERHRDRLFEAQRAVSEWLVDQIDPQPGQTILELAAGPGETGFLAAERIGPTGRLISTDLGEGMVDAARRGVEARGLTNVECRVMDGQAIDLPDASVDGVLCRFGIMLMPEPARALAGARRVLRDGGRIAYAVWGPPDRNPWMAAMAGAVVSNGHQPPGDPFGPGGPFSLGTPEVNRELAGAAGFSEVHVAEIEGVFHFEDFDDYWSLQSEVSGPLALCISTLGSGDVSNIRETLVPMLEPYRSGSAYEIPSLVVAVRAT